MNFIKQPIAVLIIVLTGFLLVGCEKGKDKRYSVDMIKARTMGLAYLEENKLPEAEETFKQLIEIAPKEALGYANLGLVYIRQGNFDQAEKQFVQALEFSPNDPEIYMNYSEVMLLTNRSDQAVELLETSIRHNPDHIKTLYKLGNIYSKSNDQTIGQKSEEYLNKVVEFLPANLNARLDLIDLLLRHNNTDMAASHMETLPTIMPEFPAEAAVFYEESLQDMLKNKADQALQPFNIFRNILKPTPLFQAGLNELTGMSGPLIGTPLITFSSNVSIKEEQNQDVLGAIRFTDASESAGLNAFFPSAENSTGKNKKILTLAVADFDGNGSQDIYTSVWNEQESTFKRFLLKNNFGKFIDIADEAGINHNGEDKDAVFADYDNDGYLDLFVVNNKQNVLYYHFEPQKFRNVAKEAGLANTGSGNTACFADFDHDGDLDIYLANQAENMFYRNNLDGTFSETSAKMAIKGTKTPSNDATFADFDDDGDLDLFVLNSASSNILYSNLRQGQFADVTSERELSDNNGSTSLATGDYNNDGRADLFISKSGNAGYSLFTNRGTTFEIDTRSVDLQNILKDYICSDAQFFDFDNDGFLDLVLTGKPKQGNSEGMGVLLFHNDGRGVFKNLSNLLPTPLPAGIKIAVADYNEDGDQDIFYCSEDGHVRLLRNDGGNANRYLKVQLVGLRTGSGKNNYFGIGAKLEIKAGELYQSQFVTGPVSHFGLGQKTKADVVRVLWTNGVPQNLFEPGSDQELLEKQILKGSCPFLYAWNGEKFEFVTDVLWRSALGMPLGIMGGETAYAFSDPSQDYFKIPGDMLKEKDGAYLIQLTAELWETAYFDQVKLLAVDHPDTSDIYIDERFTPPPYPPLNIYNVAEKKYPKLVTDDRGNDLLQVTKFKDDVYISDLKSELYQGITKSHDLLIDLGHLSAKDRITLFLNGWVFPTDASINVAMSQSSLNLVHPPILQVKDRKGNWQTVIDNISFPMGKNKFVILDLSNKFLSENYQVRIRTSMQIYWDYIFYTVGKQNIPIKVSTLSPRTADLHYRGFSRMYRKGGRFGPFWYDYSDVSTKPIWRDLVGYYTRYGDVKELLDEADSKYIITNAGDEITLEFDAAVVPPLPTGWYRDFIIFTNGWLKDGDLNTAKGQTVEPLPFIGMSKYPYEDNQHYPTDTDHQQFLKNYITRKVTNESYKRMVIDN